MYFNSQGGAVLEGNAQPENVLTGRTFYNTEADKIQTGTMPYIGATPPQGFVQSTQIGSKYTTYVKTGFYPYYTRVGDQQVSFVEEPMSRFGNATAADVKSGKTFTSSSGLALSGIHSPTRSFKHVYNTKIGVWGSASYTLTEDYDFLIINVCAIRTGVAAQCDASYSGKGTATTYRATSWWDDGCSGLSRQILVTEVSKGDKVSFGNCAYSAQVNIIGMNKN